MGCGLGKIRQTDDSSPGKIYSTLKRPQVETKIGVAYTYCHVDFLVGKEGKSIFEHATMDRYDHKEQASEQRYVHGMSTFHPEWKIVHLCGNMEDVKKQTNKKTPKDLRSELN